MVTVHAGDGTALQTSSAAHGNLSGHLIETRILHPAMDGIVLNEEQYNPDPAINSHLEWILVAIHHRDWKTAEAHALACIRSNSEERLMLRQIAGVADEAAAIERSVRGQIKGMSGNRLIQILKDPLDRLLAGPDPEAARIVVDTVRRTPPSMFRTKNVRHQLGKARIAKLEEFLGGLA